MLVGKTKNWPQHLFEIHLHKKHFKMAVSKLHWKYRRKTCDHVQCPPHSGSRIFCYLKKFLIVLMVIVDLIYKFICTDVGVHGKSFDGGILEESFMKKKLEARTFGVPEDKSLFGQVNYTFMVKIGDVEFVLKSYENFST